MAWVLLVRGITSDRSINNSNSGVCVENQMCAHPFSNVALAEFSRQLKADAFGFTTGLVLLL